MYRLFSLEYAAQIRNAEYQNMEEPTWLDCKEKALFCMKGDYGFAGTVQIAH